MRKRIIRTKMKEIEESIRLVEEHLPESFEEFSNLGLVKDGIYKRVEFAIENVFDICAIINADLNLGIPSSDEDILENLMKNNILSMKMKEKLKMMKGFRNILVHRYGKIDDKLAFRILKENLGDFYEFMREIEEFLENV
ncbi:MAG: DUF86 domain-containing protein [Candidatus Hydrothermarchaeota archaeon]|nr:MAG: DUF86 domain-containing protein [Candidatus Hydrothermarchaeota archaeon]